MSLSHVFPTSFLVLTIIFILHFQSSLSIPSELVQKICACTNTTKDDCTKILTSNPRFVPASDPKTLVPLVATDLSQSVEKALNYINSLVAKSVEDPKLKKLYEGCKVTYTETNEDIHAAFEAVKAGNLTEVSEEVADAEFNVRDCSNGAKELEVDDPSDLKN